MDIGSLLNAKSPEAGATRNKPHSGVSRRQSSNSNSSMQSQGRQGNISQYSSRVETHLKPEVAQTLQFYAQASTDHNEASLYSNQAAGTLAEARHLSYGPSSYHHTASLTTESSSSSGPSVAAQDSGVDFLDSAKLFPCGYENCAKGFARRSDLVRHGKWLKKMENFMYNPNFLPF